MFSLEPALRVALCALSESFFEVFKHIRVIPELLDLL